MSNYSSTLKLNDQFSKPLQSVIKVMNTTLNIMEKMNNTSSNGLKMGSSFAQARNELLSANTAIKQMQKSIQGTDEGIDKNTQSQKKYNQEVQKSSGLFSGLKGAVAGVLSVYAIRQSMESLDNLSNMTARLNLVNDGTQTTADLQDKIYQSAQRSRGEYTSMAASVSKLNLLAKDAFKSNDEAIFFVEQMNKQFKIGGTSVQEQTAAMYQLTQAMAAGKLQGDEFRSIMENAPMLAQAIAKEMGVSQGKLKEMSSEGKITAQIIKNAMINSADETNKMFAKIPMTFADIGNQLKNSFMKSLLPIQQTITNLMNSQAGASFISSLQNALNALVFVINTVLNVIISIGSFIQRNWGIIYPILLTIGAIFATWAVTQIPMLITKLWMMVAPVLAQAGAWLLVNWPILLIGIAIGLLLVAMLKFGDIVVKVCGVVGGIFGMLFANLYNKFAYFANIALSVAEFFANVFRDPVYAVKKLFYDLSINVLQFISNIAKGIENLLNKIPGVKVNITGALNNVLNTLETQRDNLKSDKDVVKLMRFNQMDYGDAFNKGQTIGEKAGQFAVDGVQNVAGMIGDKIGALTSNQENYFGKGNSSIGQIKGDVKVNEEDIKLLRDVAERDAINKITALSPNIQFGDLTIREDADVDKITNRISQILIEQIASSTDGVYR